MTNLNDSDAVDVVAEQVLEQLRQGEQPSLDEYVARYPELEKELRELFPSLLLMEHFGSPDVSGGLPNGETTASGRRRLGDYTIIREIGRGGMSVVYEAEQDTLGRRVAIKVLSTRSRLNPNQVRRFDRESRSVARLEHPAIVPVYGIGSDRNVPFYVMKFVNGQGLDHVLHELRNRKGLSSDSHGEEKTDFSLSVVTQALVDGVGQSSEIQATQFEPNERTEGKTRATGDNIVWTRELRAEKGESSWTGGKIPSASVFRQLSTSGSTTCLEYFKSISRIGVRVADALHYAHEQGVLHRDIKPSNLMLDLLGQVWVTDFGLAKVAHEEDITNTGEFVGTLRYTSPEQLHGWSDPRSDIYSLGVTLYELLTLRPAFPDGERATLVHRIANHDPASIRHLEPDVPRDLATIVHKAIAKEPSRRYKTAQALGEDLQRFLDNKPILAKPISIQQQLRLWARRRPAIAALSSLLVIGAITAFFVVSWLWRQAEADKQLAIRESQARRQQVYAASLAEAKAIRFSGQAALLDQAYAAVERAAEIQPTLELRNEAINIIAKPRMRLSKSIRKNALLRIDDSFSRYAYADGDTIVMRSLDDDRELVRLSRPSGEGDDFEMVQRVSGDGRFMICWQPNGKSGPNTEVLHVDSNEPVLSFSSDSVIQFAPDVGYVACSAGQNRIDFHSLSAKETPKSIEHPKTVRRFDIAPHRALLALGELGTKIVVVYDLETGVPETEFELPADSHGIRWSPSGRYLATGCTNGTFCVWDTESGTKTHTIDAHFGSVWDFSFHPSEDLISSMAWGHETAIWDLRTNRLLKQFDQQAGVFSADGRSYVTSYKGEADVWQLLDSDCLHEISIGEAVGWSSLAASPDGALVGVALKNGVRIWEIETKQPAARIPSGNTDTVAFHPDGRQLLTTGERGFLVWDLPKALAGEGQSPRTIALPAQSEWLKFFAVDASGAKAALVNDRQSVSVRDLVKNELLLKIPASRHAGLSMVTINHDGSYVATGTWHGNGIRVFDVSTGELIKELVPGARNAHAEFSPDGRLLVVSSHQSVLAWNTETWQSAWEEAAPIVRTVVAPNRGRFSPDGRLLAYRPRRGTIRLLWASSGSEIATLEQRDGLNYTDLCFTPDGTKLVGLVAQSRLIQIWDLRQLNERLRRLGLHWQ